MRLPRTQQTSAVSDGPKENRKKHQQRRQTELLLVRYEENPPDGKHDEDTECQPAKPRVPRFVPPESASVSLSRGREHRSGERRHRARKLPSIGLNPTRVVRVHARSRETGLGRPKTSCVS